jgi:hypothetical protein
MTYSRTSDFSTEPEELRRDLQRLDLSVSSAFGELEAPMLGRTVRRVTSATTLKFGELLVVDTSNASITLTLPQTANNRALNSGRGFGVMRRSLVNQLVLQAAGADLINRATSYSVAPVYGLFLVVFDGTEYWVR